MNPMKVITGPETLWSYVNAWEPKSINGSAPKYSVQLRIPKTDKVTLEKIERAIKAAYEEGAAKLKGNSKSVPPLSTLKTPLRDGDESFPDDGHLHRPHLCGSFHRRRLVQLFDGAEEVVGHTSEPCAQRL